jgi:hypothetical protein
MSNKVNKELTAHRTWTDATKAWRNGFGQFQRYQLELLGLEEIPNEGRGDCAFRSLWPAFREANLVTNADILSFRRWFVDKLRQLVTDLDARVFILDFDTPVPLLFLLPPDETLDMYCHRMAIAGQWGDVLVLATASILLRLPVSVVGTEEALITPVNPVVGHAVVLGYSGDHYVATRRKEQRDNQLHSNGGSKTHLKVRRLPNQTYPF